MDLFELLQVGKKSRWYQMFIEEIQKFNKLQNILAFKIWPRWWCDVRLRF